MAERAFLLSMKEGEPRWDLIEIDGVEKLPALQWKLSNIRKIPKAKHDSAVEKLRLVLKI